MSSAGSPADSKFPAEKRNATALGPRTEAWVVGGRTAGTQGLLLLQKHLSPEWLGWRSHTCLMGSVADSMCFSGQASSD